MVSDSRFHRRCNTQCLVNASEIVVNEMQGQRVPHILDLLGMGVCEPREAPHLHPEREVIPLYVASGNLAGVRIARNLYLATPDTLRRAVTCLAGFAVIPIKLDKHRIVHVDTERTVYRL